MIAAAIGDPFPGLRPFTTQESELFFGRDEQVDELVARLAGRRFLAVVGASGSGKSSLVRAGLIPILQHGHLGPPGSEWVIAIVSRPGIDPLHALARALLEALRLDSSELSGVEAALDKNSLGLTTLARQHLREHQRLFILVDQFEELFRYRKQPGEGGASSQRPLSSFCSLPLGRVISYPWTVSRSSTSSSLCAPIIWASAPSSAVFPRL